MDGFYKTLIILGIISIVYLIAQLLFCFKTKKITTKLIPVYILLLCALLAITLYIDFFDMNRGFIGGSSILAGIFAIGIVAALIGDMVAWIIYGVYKVKRIK